MPSSKSRSRRLLSALALLLFGSWPAAQATVVPLTNRLANHASPYLRMHAADPLAWQEWGRGVLERARTEDKLVFVSVGYFSCHWCHVMQRESYRDPAIAGFVNDAFIPVKVDRELDPVLDAELIEFSERTSGRAGWPLNVFLTPEGYPLYALLYLPPGEFRAAIDRLQELWRTDRERLRKLAMRESAPPAAAPYVAIDASLVERWRGAFRAAALGLADTVEGGFGQLAEMRPSQKFPMVPQLEAALGEVQRGGNERLRAHLALTLEQMAAGGLRDHVEGGFFRYTVDPNWETPHFEKMLYDNALLARLYLAASPVLKQPDFEALGRETLDFLLARMRTSSGAFVASFSAVDGRGVEGGYYLWRADELKRLLTEDELRVAGVWYGMEGAAPLEAGFLPRRTMAAGAAAQRLGLPPERVEARWRSARAKLLKAREKRALPVDDKQLAGWNGLALSALAQGATLANSARYREAAEKLARYLGSELWDGRRLRRALKDGVELGRPSLEDYAYVAQGLLAYAGVTQLASDLDLSGRFIDEAWRRYFDGAWRLAEDELLAGRAKRAAVDDGPLPSPAAVLLSTSIAYARMRRAPAYPAVLEQALRAAQPAVAENPFWHASYVSAAADFLTRPLR